MKTLRCTLCSQSIVVTLPAEPEVQGIVQVDAAERQFGWGASQDYKVLCKWHAPMNRVVKLRDAVDDAVRRGRL
jgi:hypothetical protein